MRKQRTPPKIVHIALVVGFTLLLGACGLGPTESPPTGEDSTTTIPPSSTSTTAPQPEDPTATTVPEPPTTTMQQPTDVPPDAVEVAVYLLGTDVSDCAAVTPVTRMVEPPTLLTGAIEALLTGPTAEERAAGYDSWFTPDTGWSVDSVTITDGVAWIDFSEDSQLIPNASTSCGSMALRAQMDSTATQFPTVDRAVYSFGGDLEAFYHWLQADVPEL